jgi:hypothetical protein
MSVDIPRRRSGRQQEAFSGGGLPQLAVEAEEDLDLRIDRVRGTGAGQLDRVVRA